MPPENSLGKSVDELAEEKLNKLLIPVDTKNIISFDRTTGVIYLGGELVDAKILQSLKSEAEAFKVSELWKLLYNTPNELAQKAMFSDAGDLEKQLIKGRAMLFLLDTQKKIIEILTQVKTG